MELYSRPHICVDGSVGVSSRDYCLEKELKLKQRVEDYQKENNLIDENDQLRAKREVWIKENLQFRFAFEEEKLRLAAEKLENKKSKCRDYGFKDETDVMGLCLIELDKLAKLEEQILAIEKRNNQVYLQNQQLIADQQRQREAQALINLGGAISGAGVPRTNTPKTPITTYPNSFSSSLTVPSNQVCPILSTPITKQEIRGANRICYYQ